MPEIGTFLRYADHRWHRDERNLRVRALAELAIREELHRLSASPAGRAEFQSLEHVKGFRERVARRLSGPRRPSTHFRQAADS